ncbi:NRDE family protein [Azovibrio restrictus]|uniref:NRDE family protein n=1 Tax=Azovibrio restrictus TaxID=146938 RepID=UPI0026EC5F6C|nr:NRDE family protein [Azovibrio restrictus]
MCLILIAWQVHADYPLVLAANRDEWYDRPSLPLAVWDDAPNILGGRDLQAGGSWLACHRDGRFAAVTNVRQGTPEKAPRSRGDLVRNYLNKNTQPIEFAESVQQDQYGGFNLLLGNGEELVYLSNREAGPALRLPPGIYGLSNHRLDSPWPKLVKAREHFGRALTRLPDEEALFRVLADREQADDRDLPDTGVPLATERMLSSIFVVSDTYGTRCSTLLCRNRGGQLWMTERRFGPGGQPLGGTQLSTMSTGV